MKIFNTVNQSCYIIVNAVLKSTNIIASNYFEKFTRSKIVNQ